MLDATTSQACSFLHCPLTFCIVLSAIASQSLSVDRPAGTLGHVTWSSRPQKALVTLMSSYCLHCSQPFSPSQMTVKFCGQVRRRGQCVAMYVAAIHHSETRRLWHNWALFSELLKLIHQDSDNFSTFANVTFLSFQRHVQSTNAS